MPRIRITRRPLLARRGWTRRLGTLALLSSAVTFGGGSASAATQDVQTLTAPYAMAATSSDGTCDFAPADPAGSSCVEQADASGADGRLGVASHVALPSPSIAARSGAGTADATSWLSSGFVDRHAKHAGGTITATFVIEVLGTPTAAATAGDRAEVIINASVSAACGAQGCAAFATSGNLPLAVDDCPQDDEYCLAARGCPCLGPGIHAIAVTLQLPADRVTKVGTVQVTTRSRSLLAPQTRMSLEEQPHESQARADIKVLRITLQRS